MRTPGLLRRGALAAPALALAACNTIFGIEPGEPRPAGSGGAPGVCGAADPPGEGPLRWASQSTRSSYALATGVALGAQGDVIVAGVYSAGDLQIGASTLPHAGDPDDFDVFLASFDAATGEPRWVRGFPADGQQIASDVEVDRVSGDIVLSGRFEGSVSFDGGATTLPSSGASDAFLARFDPQGDPLWSARYGDAEEQVAINVAFDGLGEIVFGALVAGTIDFAGETMGTPGSAGLLVGKLGADSEERWGRFYPSAFHDGEHVGLDADADGHIVVTGSASTFGFDSQDPFHGGTDVFVVKYDKEGATLWSRLFGGTGVEADNGQQWGTAAAFDCRGDVVLTGAFRKDLVFGDIPALTAADAADPGDVFVARLRGADGAPLWAKAFGDAGLQRGLSIGTDGRSSVVVGGILVDADASVGVDFGGGLLPPPGKDGADHREDLFVAKLSPEGDHLWSKRIGDELTQEGEIAVDPSGSVVAAGDFFSEIRLDPTPAGALTDDGRDLFVALFGP